MSSAEVGRRVRGTARRNRQSWRSVVVSVLVSIALLVSLAAVAAPTVTSTTPTLVAEADVGTVNVTITFSESMLQTSSVTVNVEGPGLPWGPIHVSGAWTDATHWDGSFTLSDQNDETTSTYYRISGARSTLGEDMVPLVSRGTNNAIDIDTVQPDVTINQAGGQADPTNASPVTFTAVFDEPINDAMFTNSDVSVGGTATTGAVTVTEIAPNDDTTFEVSIVVTGDGTVVPTIPAGGVEDVAGNTNTASTSTDNSVTVDTDKPDVTINQVGGQADPTSASPVTFTAVFDEPMNNATFTSSDVTVGGTATTGVVTVTEIAPNDDTTFEVSIVVTGDGTVVPTIPAGGVEDPAGNTNNASTSTDNSVTYDNTAPQVTSVNFADFPDDNLITDADVGDGADCAIYVYFDEPMKTDGSADPVLLFNPNVDSTLAPGSGTLEWVSSSVYRWLTSELDAGVDVSSVTIDVSGAEDAASNPMVDYTPVNEFGIETENPTITQIIRDDLNPTNAAQVSMQVDFSESVDGVVIGNFTPVGTGGQLTASIDSVFTVGPSVLWIIRLNTVDDATGTLTIDLDKNLSGITDAVGNELLVGRSGDETYDVDRLDPTVTVNIADTLLSDPDNQSLVTFEFSEDVTGFDVTDLTPTNGTLTSFTTIDADSYTVIFTATDGIDDAGTVAVGTGYTDTIGNTGTAGSDTVDIDTENPTVTSIVYLDSTSDYAVTTDADTNDWPNAAAVHVYFSEPMTTDGSADPTITFGPNVDSTLPPGSASVAWESNTEFAWGTFEEDANLHVGSVTIDASGAKDAAGNDMIDYTPVHEFEIDTDNPMVTNLVVSDTLITDADTPGVQSFEVEVTFSEAMTNNGSADPTFVFDPSVATTLTHNPPIDGWEGSDTGFITLYDVADANVDVEDIDIDVTGATDANGNPIQDYTPSKEMDIDTLNPSATVVFTDALLTDADAESLVTITFSEAVSNFTLADLTPTNGSLTTFTPVNLAEWTVLFTADDDVDGAGSVAVGTDYEDYRGNPPNSGASGDTDIDTRNPEVSTVVADTAIIYEGDLIQDVTVAFNEPMDTATDPTITFGVGTFTTNSDGNWDSSTQYSESFTHTDTDIEQTYVEIGVSGAKDAVGNDQQPYTPEDEFDIDTLAPTVTSLYLASSPDTTITDWDVADATQDGLYVHFSEPMTNDGSADPVFSFDPDVTHTLPNGDNSLWVPSNPDTVYGYFTNALDGNVDVNSVDVDVTGARDAVGNLLVPYSQTAVFDIDTLNPTISSITSITLDGYYNTGTIDVTVTFSEQVTLSGGTLDVTLNTPSDVVSLTGFTGWPDASTNYTIGAGDNSCDLDAIGIVLNGGTLRDLVGNDAVVSLPATTIADGSDIVVDTTNPVISGLDLPDTTQSVDAGCSITIPYSATLTDNCCINTGVGSTDVQVNVSIVGGAGTASLDAPAATITNNGIDQIDISGSFTVSDVSGGDVDVQVEIDCIDCAGNSPAAVSDTVTIDDSTDPVVSGFNLPDNILYMDPDTCIYTVPYSATVTDNCCLDAGNVSVVVELVAPFDTATLTAPAASIANAGGSPNTQVDISGSFEVSALTDDPVHVRIRINATDCNGNAMTEVSDTAVFEDGTNPTIGWNTDLPDTTQYVDEFTCVIVIPVQATVTDACCINAGDVDIDIQLTNATLSHTVTASQVSQGVIDVSGNITVSALTGCPADLSITISGTDCAGNDAAQLTDSAVIRDNTIPIINNLMFNTDDTYAVQKVVPYLVDECGQVVVYFSANVTDNCCIVPGNVNVSVTLPMLAGEGSAILEDIVISRVQNGQGRVDVTGHAVVRCLESCPPSICPSRVQVDITAADCCGNVATPVQTGTGEGLVDDIILPIPKDDPRQDMVMDESAVIDPLVEVRIDEFGTYRLILRESTPVRIDIMGNDADNLSHNVAHPFGPCIACGPCGGQTGCCAVMYIHEIVKAPSYGTATIEDDTGDCTGGTVIRYAPDRGYLGPDYFTYRTRDAFGNISSVIATVYLQTVPEVWMEDVFAIACEGETIEFTVSAADLFIDPDDPSIIQFGFSVTDGPEHGVVGGDLLDVFYTPPSMSTDPQFGVLVPSLDFSEAAAVTLTYTPADGFTGIDAIRVRFEDPFGGVAHAVVNITVGDCSGPMATGDSLIRVAQCEGIVLIVPSSFETVFEAGWTTVTLASLENGQAYSGSITVEWSEQVNRHILTINTEGLPVGSYELTIPLGTGETVTLTIEVGEAT